MSGRPTSAEPRNTAASTTVVATGWMKYMNALPLEIPTTVRTVRPIVARMSTPGMRWPCRRRAEHRAVRPAQHDHHRRAPVPRYIIAT